MGAALLDDGVNAEGANQGEDDGHDNEEAHEGDAGGDEKVLQLVSSRMT
jgi:hypothetical protein